MASRKKCRPSDRDTKEDEVAKKRLAQIAKRFSYREMFEKDFKSDACDSRTLCLKSVAYLENYETREPDRFWLDMTKSNYLTMLYYNCEPPKYEEAIRLNEDTLKREPRNFNALWCKCEIYRRQKMFQLVKAALETMDDVLEDSVVLATAKAEIGVNYSDFGPQFYQRAVELVESVLKEIRSTAMSEEQRLLLQPRVVKWKFDLIRTYNRLMNKGTIQSYWDGRGEPLPNHEYLFRRIKELHQDVTAGDDVSYRAMAWVELGDAYKKYEEKVREDQRTELLPDGMTFDDCFEMALRLGPEDAFVLERCGRHRRQRAKGIEEFKAAVELLRKCVEQDPLRDVAHHHLGLAYRSMWLEAEGHEAARLHTNKTKRFGEKRSIRKMCDRAANANGRPSPGSSNVRKATQCNVSDRVSPKTPNPAQSGQFFGRSAGDKTMQYGRSASHNGCCFQEGEGDASCFVNPPRRQLRSLPETPVTYTGTIPPRFPVKENEVPRHYRKPDYYDKLRSNNPEAKDLKHHYLMSARECFQKASDIRHGKSCRYSVDLARTYISTNDNKTARKLFVQASESDYNSNDGAYLFEQWGLMEEAQVRGRCEAPGEPPESQDYEEVKNFYRQAIQFSAESLERSRMAFYHLRDILFQQKQQDPISEILEKEHLLLYTTIQDAAKAIEILDKMKTDPKNIVLMWELVDLFHARYRPEDAGAAFTYLALLADAGKLREHVDECDSSAEEGKEQEKEEEEEEQEEQEEGKGEYLTDRIKKVIEISRRKLSNENDRSPQDTLSRAFAWLLILSDSGSAKGKARHPSKICLLAPSYETPDVDLVKELLQNVLGVEILVGFVEGFCDISEGEYTAEGVAEIAMSVDNVVVIMHQIGKEADESELLMQHCLKTILHHPDYLPKRFCQVVSSRHKDVPLGIFGTLLSKWNLDEEGGEETSKQVQDARLVLRFLTAIFLSQPLEKREQPNCSDFERTMHLRT